MNDKEQKIIFSKNLNSLLSQRNKTQKEVADAISVSPQTFNTWCQGIALPRMSKVQKLADYFHVERSDLIDDRSFQPNHTYHKGVVINVYGDIIAGIPLEKIKDIIDTEEIPESMARTGDFFGLQIKGDSMDPKISNGDVVIVRRQDNAETGDVVIATVNGDKAACKRLRKYRDGIELISNNPSYESMFFSNEEIEQKPVKIIGRVVELRAKF